MSKRWFHLSTSGAGAVAALAACEARHLASGRGDFSIVPNRAGNEVVVKVAGADKAWRQSQSWMADRLGIWDESDHDGLAAMMQGSAWVDPADVPND